MTTIEQRVQFLVNTDRQRRCYDGTHFSGELRWTEWGTLCTTLKDPDEALAFFRELNDYAVSQGQVRREYRVKESK